MAVAVAAMPLSASAQLAATDQPYPGQTWMVACQKLPVHVSDSGYSKTVGELNYKDHVKIARLTGEFQLPESQKPASVNDSTEASAFDVAGAGEVKNFAWAQISGPAGQKGFVPMNCLINANLVNGPHEDPGEYATQKVVLSGKVNATVSSRGFSKKEKGDRVAMRGMSPSDPVQECTPEMIEDNAKATVSSRGFSKKEKGDQVAMRGMTKNASDGICVREDYEGLRAYIEKVPFVSDPYKADLAFRKEGGLGEFQK